MTALELPATMTLEEQLDALRDGYCNAINDVLDGCLSTLALPMHQEALCQDAAQFLVYILAVKIVTNNGQPVELRHLMQAYRHLNKRIEKEVPTMLLEFTRAHQAQARLQPGETAQ